MELKRVSDKKLRNIAGQAVLIHPAVERGCQPASATGWQGRAASPAARQTLPGAPRATSTSAYRPIDAAVEDVYALDDQERRLVPRCATRGASLAGSSLSTATRSALSGCGCHDTLRQTSSPTRHTEPTWQATDRLTGPAASSTVQRSMPRRRAGRGSYWPGSAARTAKRSRWLPASGWLAASGRLMGLLPACPRLSTRRSAGARVSPTAAAASGRRRTSRRCATRA